MGAPGARPESEAAKGKSDRRFTWSEALLDAARAGITPEVFYGSTLREVSIMLQGAAFRRDQGTRLAISAARTTAVLMRMKRIPPVSRLLKEQERKLEYRTPQEQRFFLREWVRGAKKATKGQRYAITIGRLDKPAEPSQVAISGRRVDG